MTPSSMRAVSSSMFQRPILILLPEKRDFLVGQTVTWVQTPWFYVVPLIVFSLTLNSLVTSGKGRTHPTEADIKVPHTSHRNGAGKIYY